MNKLEKPVKGKNIKHILDAFFDKYIRKHFNQVNSIDFIISDLGERMADGGRNIKILRNDNPVRTNNPDWFPPKAQQTDHICTFLKQLMDNELGTKDSYVGLKVEVVTETKTYTWDVKAVDYYASSGTVILKTDSRQGVTIECPAIVRVYIYPLLTSKAVSSIIYNSIVTSKSKYNFILGERNIHKGEDNVWIFGKNNLSGETNHNSLINGYNNDVDSYGNIVIGDSNKHRSLLGVTIGRYIKNFKQNSFLFGTGHDNSNGPSHEAIFGKYSNIEEDTVFAIGDGENENNRHNLFEIKDGGAILDKDGNDIRFGKGVNRYLLNDESIYPENIKVGDIILFDNHHFVEYPDDCVSYIRYIKTYGVVVGTKTSSGIKFINVIGTQRYICKNRKIKLDSILFNGKFEYNNGNWSIEHDPSCGCDLNRSYYYTEHYENNYIKAIGTNICFNRSTYDTINAVIFGETILPKISSNDLYIKKSKVIERFSRLPNYIMAINLSYNVVVEDLDRISDDIKLIKGTKLKANIIGFEPNDKDNEIFKFNVRVRVQDVCELYNTSEMPPIELAFIKFDIVIPLCFEPPIDYPYYFVTENIEKHTIITY